MQMKIEPIIKKPEGFAIYNPKTQLYSAGGISPKWRKMGKIWQIGPIKNHLYQFVRSDYSNHTYVISNTYDGCIIVDLETNQESEMKIEDIYQKYIDMQRTRYKQRNWTIRKQK